MIGKTYCVENFTGFVIVKHGETGFYETNIRDDGEAAVYNMIHGATENEVMVAECCSMFDIWDKFERMLARLDMVDEAVH